MVIQWYMSSLNLMRRAEGPIETEPWSHNQPSIIFFGLALWHFLALKSWFQEEARMWKSVPQVRQAHILSTWSQDFLQIDPMAKKATLFSGISTVGQARAAFAVRIIWGARVPELQVDQAGNESTSRYIGFCLCQKRFWCFDNADWSLRTRKAQNVSASFSKTHSLFCHLLPQFFGGRNSFAYCVSKIHFWNLYDPGTYWRVRKMVEWSLRWYWSILVSMIRSNGCWKLTWKVKSVFQEENNDIFLCKWSQLKVEPAVRITVTTSWWCEAQWWHHVQILERRQLAKLQQGGIIVWHLVYVHIKFIYDYVGMGVYIYHYPRLLDIDISLDVLRMMPTDTKSGCKFHDFWWFPNSKLQISKFMNQASRVWLFGFGA